MPGLPKYLLSTYQKYKNHTDSIAQWLASTAKKHGYVSPKSKKRGQTGNTSKGPLTYTVAFKEWTVLAEYIAGLTDPPVDVPVKLAVLLETTIGLRQSYSNDVSLILEDSDAKRGSDATHASFLSVLKKVRDLLGPRLPKEHLSPEHQPSTAAEVVNLFDHLELEEPSQAFEQAPDIAPVTSTNEPIYHAERQDNLEEAFFALHLLLSDFNRLRTEVSHAWAGYKNGLVDLIAASITTNTAVDLARSMTDDLKTIFAKHGGGARMLQVYYAAQCIGDGTSESYKIRQGDDMNFKTYELADVLFYPAFQLLDAFCRVLQAGPDPQMKRGIYGHYKPQSDRDAKSKREKFVEDKILLLEMLEEFYFYFRTTKPPGSRPSVEDELTRGLRIMFETREVTLPLAFATTLFLDIHHILRHEVDSGFQRMADVTRFVQIDVEEELKFHEGIDMETWPAENDRHVQQFVDTLQFWCLEDRQRIAAQKLKRTNIPEAFCLYRNHPWLCGMWKYFTQMRFHEISIVFVNAWGSVMSCAHLYNAVQGSKPMDTTWKDMDVVIGLQDEKTFFIGKHPTAVDDCLKRFALAMGASATNLAKSTRKKKGLTLSKRGPKGLKEGGTILQAFKGRICDGNDQNDINAEHVQKILEGSRWGYKLNEDDRVDEVYKDTDEAPKKTLAKHLHVAKLLGLLRDVIHAETIEIAFDYLRLHRMCWRLLRSIKEHCRGDLIRIFGPTYIEKESQLPFVVGYVLLSATSSQQTGDLLNARLPGVEVTDKLLADAKGVVQALIGAAGALIVEHALPKIGVHIDFEFQRGE